MTKGKPETVNGVRMNVDRDLKGLHKSGGAIRVGSGTIAVPVGCPTCGSPDMETSFGRTMRVVDHTGVWMDFPSYLRVRYRCGCEISCRYVDPGMDPRKEWSVSHACPLETERSLEDWTQSTGGLQPL